ncbi:hypothetical protein C357_14386, partial [Citreicella sp. 357]
MTRTEENSAIGRAILCCSSNRLARHVTSLVERVSRFTVLLKNANTHLHEFDLNWTGSPERLRKNGLTVAREITEADRVSFEDVRDYAGKRIRINNIEVAPGPM